MTTINMPTGNLVDETLVIVGFTVHVNGNESPDGDAPLREDWVFGAEGGALGIESNAARPLHLNHPVIVSDVKGYVQAAPTGSGITFTILRRHYVLADADHSRRSDRRGRRPVAY